MKTEDEMYEQIDKAVESQDTVGTAWPGMSYEDGVKNALNWVIGNDAEGPMDGDD